MFIARSRAAPEKAHSAFFRFFGGIRGCG
jgi:hypothetical protein